MMGRQDRDQRQLFYEFSLDEMIPADHLLRRINVFATAVLADLHEQLKAFYSDIGRPWVDPELMIRMLLVGYCYGIRHERRLCQEVALHLAYRWFCKLDLDDKVPHHSTFSVNRLGRFRESERCTQSCPFTEGHARVRAIEQCTQKSREEMRFAHLKVQHGFERMRLRGLTGARDEFHLAAIVQNLKTMALRLLGPPTDGVCASIA